ncbi:L-serine ammonia-lyase, iron-sulfur-dependent, subunit alpha [Eubacterium sp.]|uniref:L-serine ammonia-lyase, iron-sulfur-dependent, subunit alpha n=1 Tax=Eubacterium sp. TaxID=142586 RepID=UPI0026DF8643|nr:L-serine ammonia-lyase, iron-sulfur-dependent, subunit alpha [Eubacterium sp.]MDO5434363.1 L-serine ammonia-lyase, iron-sulfur-dependent, subunit alpha [Eubacterium sp.]
MINYKTSIFNDVLGPVMTGPSSSHTAGPGRIGYFTGCLMPDFKSVKLIFPKSSSYATTYKGQKSDIAFAAGLLGLPLNHPDFKNSLHRLKEKNIAFETSLTDTACDHPNTCELVLSGPSGRLCITSLSTGGGMFCVTAINGSAVDFKGDTPVLAGFYTAESQAALRDFLKTLPSSIADTEGLISGNGFYALPLKTSAAAAEIKRLIKTAPGTLRYIPAILPVATPKPETLPFSTAGALSLFLQKNPMPLWQAAIEYEAARSGWTAEEVLNYSKTLVKIMCQSISFGLQDAPDGESLTARSARSMAAAASAGRLLSASPYQSGAVYSTAVMEASNAMGVVVAGPTAGSCGVLPGVLFALLQEAGRPASFPPILSDKHSDQAAKALLCAGIIGVFIAEQATFAAELCGCQAENGAASAMAAAMAVSFSGGGPDQSLRAASTALQNVLGLICDPVACRVEIPCISRNAMAVSNALTSAEMTLGGYDSRIPLDETIKTMYRVGRQLPPELRCTGNGGLCLTPAAFAMAEKAGRPHK